MLYVFGAAFVGLFFGVATGMKTGKRETNALWLRAISKLDLDARTQIEILEQVRLLGRSI